MISAWATNSRIALGQCAVDGKSNEITAIPELLELIDLENTVVTIDAMGCQKEIAAKVVERGGDYLLAVKDNHPKLHKEIQHLFSRADHPEYTTLVHDRYESNDKGHGRIEKRCLPDHHGSTPNQIA